MKKKILFFISTLTGGGAEKALVDLVNNLDKEKYDITIQTIIDEGIHKSNLLPHIKYKTINRFNNKFLKKLFTYLIYHIVPPTITYNLFIKDKYDYEVAFLEGLPTKILGYSTNKKAIKYAWVHIDLYNYFEHEKLFKKFNRHIECYKKYDRIICVSKAAKEGFIKRFGINHNIVVKYNILDVKNIIDKSKEKINEVQLNNNFKIVSVGRLCEVKGYTRLLKVHDKLIKEGYKYELWIVGEGNEKETLKNYIYKNKLEDTVKILGFQKNPYKFINEADIFVCSSIVEGFSLVIAEALILNKAVISTKCSGPYEILEDSTYGLMVENDKEGLYDGIKSMLEDRNKLEYYKQMSKKRAHLFNTKNSVEEIEELFRSQYK